MVTTAPALAVGLVSAKLPGRWSAAVVLAGALWFGLGMSAFVATDRTDATPLRAGVYGWVLSLVVVTGYWMVWSSVRLWWHYRALVAPHRRGRAD